MEALRCPGCGGSELTRIAGREYVCDHCRTRAVLSPDKHVLVLAGRKCPECGFVNDSSARFCGGCGCKLTKACPSCGAEVSIDLAFCSACGHDFSSDPGQLLQMVEANGGPNGLDLTHRDLSGINLTRDAIQAELDKARAANPEINPPWWAPFGGFNLAGANLKAADLSGANLERVFLQGANLAGADLREAVLSGAFLKRADLRQANLREANLRGAYLGSARLHGADLTGADLTDINLPNANLRGAELDGADQLTASKSLAGTTLPDGTKLSKSLWQLGFEEWRRK